MLLTERDRATETWAFHWHTHPHIHTHFSSHAHTCSSEDKKSAMFFFPLDLAASSLEALGKWKLIDRPSLYRLKNTLAWVKLSRHRPKTTPVLTRLVRKVPMMFQNSGKLNPELFICSKNDSSKWEMSSTQILKPSIQILASRQLSVRAGMQKWWLIKSQKWLRENASGLIDLLTFM